MMKGYSQILKKNIPEDFVDSADELEASIDESDAPSHKLPSSNIKLDASRFSSKNLEAGHRARNEKRSSPLREKSSNIQNQAKFADDEESAKLKKIMYNKSPKEAANEYLAMSKHQTNQPKTHHGKGPKLGGSSPREKNYPYSFNSGSAANKENYNTREDDYGDENKVSAHTELAADIYNKRFHSNSQSRQINLGKTAKDDLLLAQNELQKIEERRYFASGEAQEDVVERLIRQGEIMNEHTKALTSAYLTKEFEECTFNPQVKGSNKPRRNFDQFLEDQKQFQEQVEMKKKRAQEKAMVEKSKEEASYKPSINQNSVRLLDKRRKEEPIYQRLYSMGKNAQMKHMRVIAEKEDMYSNNRDSVASSQFIGAINTKGDSFYSHGGSSSLDRGNTPKFVPNIQKKSKNLKRGERIDNLLYNDALRRQHKTLEASKTQSKVSTAGMSSASKRALAIRFIKEFDIAILEFLEMGKEPKLNYLKLNEFLKKLCFLKESEQVDNPHFTPERILLYDAWYTLQADKFSGVHRRNLLVFLLGILNLHFPITKIQAHNPEEEQEEKEEEEKDQEDEEDMGTSPMFDQYKNPILPEEEGQPARERRIIGSFDEEGNYELSETEVRRLHKVYELWYLNRLCSADNLGQLISMRSQQEYSHHPEINETSRNLAQNYREKMLEGTAELIQQNKIPVPKDGKITHVDLLIVSKKVLEEKVNKFGEMIKEEEARDCTFKPAITQYDHGLNTSTLGTAERYQSNQSRRQKTMPADSLGRDRVFELYSLAKPQILKKDKDALEADFEKNAEECTFQPNINRETRSFMEEPSEFYAKGIEKTIERMRGARVEKERQILQKERGFATGSERNFVFGIDKRKFGRDKTFAEQGNSLQRDVYRGNFAYNYNGAPQYMSNQQAMEHQAHMMEGDTYEGQEEYQNYQYQRHDNRGAMYDQQDQELNEVQEDENEGENAESNYNTNRYMQGHGDNNEEHPQFQRDQGEDREGDERVPLLFVDVNLGQGRSERIVVYEGDKSEDLAKEFAEEHGLDPSMKIKLKELLDSQIASLLSQIDEELNSETDRNHQSDNYMQDQIQEEDYVEEESTGGR